MRRFSFISLILMFILMIAMPVHAQNDTDSINITCPDGTEILNAVEVVVNMRPSFTYTATAIGINGYDPVIGVGDEGGINLCNDDERDARTYSVALPSTGEVDTSNTTAQMPFFHSNSGLSNISLVIGSPDGSEGEFVLILEGMAVTTNDGSGQGAGDPYFVQITQNIVNSGVPLSVYMISKVQNLDPYMQLVDSDLNVVTLDDGSTIECDDAGSKSCWSEIDDLSDSYVSDAPGEGIPGGDVDAAISLNLDNFEVYPDPADNYLQYLMTSSNQRTFGEYIVVFHMGVGDGGGSGSSNNNNNNNGTSTNTSSGDKPEIGGLASGVPAPDKTKPDKDNTNTQTQTNNAPQGIDVECPDGTEILNAVEVTVSMRPGFTYTATAMGINGYDPIIGVGDSSGINLCQDDDRAARQYTVDLPTTGFVDSANSNSQMPFFHSNSGFSTISLIVGSADGSSGEFVLILEGMAVTTNDGKGEGAGDPYAVHVTQSMVDSGVPLNIYMIAKVQDLDPFIQLVHSDNTVVELDDGSRVECDDAGTDSCWGESTDLSESYVSDAPGEGIPGGGVDAMMNISLEGMSLDPDTNNNFFNFLMTSANQRTFGDYIVVFHMGV
jgi:hypothetical protein